MDVDRRIPLLSQAFDPEVDEVPMPDKRPVESERIDTERRNPGSGRGVGQELEDFRSRRDSPLGPYYRDWHGNIPM